jgi:hypothetical protein
MKPSIVTIAAALALSGSAHAGSGWSQTNPNGYTFGKTPDGRSFWAQTRPDGYTYGHVSEPPAEPPSTTCLLTETTPDGFANCFH